MAALPHTATPVRLMERVPKTTAERGGARKGGGYSGVSCQAASVFILYYNKGGGS